MRTARVPDECAGTRLDLVLCGLFPEFSRARLQHWIREGAATIDDSPFRPRDRARGGERLELRVTGEPLGEWHAQPLPLAPVYSDQHVLVIDKPAGLVVHPGAGNPDHTLVNALLHHDAALAAIPRAGIVHRLDKDTSGLLVVARTLEAHKHLVNALGEHAVAREYLALVRGALVAGGTVDAPLGRHRYARTRMAVTAGGRRAVTHYRVAERLGRFTLVVVQLETGRTHQIRVHMAHRGHAIVGDPVYGGRTRLPAGNPPGLSEALACFRRQALHAWRLGFTHPASGEALRFESAVPADMEALLDALRAHAGSAM